MAIRTTWILGRGKRIATFVGMLAVFGLLSVANPQVALAQGNDKEAIKELCELNHGNFVETDGAYYCLMPGDGGCGFNTTEPGGAKGRNGKADGRDAGGECWDGKGKITQTFRKGGVARLTSLLGPVAVSHGR